MQHPFLNLPSDPIPDRVSLTTRLPAGERLTCAELEGPGCIRHIWMAWGMQENMGRQAILRIFFDDATVPHVEAPVSDFFGVMHGKAWYPINTPWLSVKAKSGYNAYFAMPFASGARIEIEAGPVDQAVYIMVNWHRYPGAELREPMRFRACWRREYPTQRYGEAFQMVDADGPGRLLGFVYGVRLEDNTDRWSHGGADNIYIDGEGEDPVYLRGIGGEDTFGTAYGGALHTPETHLYSGMPYYVHEDTGEPRPAQRVVGYRFFEPDSIPFRESLHMRFGCMRNDICATTYWYQAPPPRPMVRMPDWEDIAYLKINRWSPSRELPRGACDLPLPDSGGWRLCGPFALREECVAGTLPAEIEAIDPAAELDAGHAEGSPWISERSCADGVNVARWVIRAATHGFVDFNHGFQPRIYGVGVTADAIAVARGTIEAEAPGAAEIRLGWDDTLVLHVNGERHDLGTHRAFRSRTVSVPLRQGANDIAIKLTNTKGSNHGGWVFAFRAMDAQGRRLYPRPA